MLTAKEAAKLTVKSEEDMLGQCKLIWLSKIETCIYYASARGETEYNYYMVDYSEKEACAIKKIAIDLGYIAQIDNKEHTILISWIRDFEELKKI